MYNSISTTKIFVTFDHFRFSWSAIFKIVIDTEKFEMESGWKQLLLSSFPTFTFTYSTYIGA